MQRNPDLFRQRVLADFLIGGFASANSDSLITLDPTYYRNYFPALAILDDPSRIRVTAFVHIM